MKNVNNFWSGKRVFVTGHTGFKGAWLCLILKILGADVYGYALESPTTPCLYNLLRLDRDISGVNGDIRDFDALRTAFDSARAEIVLHLAAQPLVLESYRNPRYTYDVNVMGTVNVLECVRLSESIRSAVNVTTDKVYENRELGNAFKEDEPLNGFDPYSNSKSCSELVTSAYKNSFFSKHDSPSISTARAGNVIGGGDFSDNRIIPDCVRAVQDGTSLVLRNPASIRPYQHVLEPLAMYLEIARKQYKDGSFAGSYNIGPDIEDCVTTETLAKLWKEHFPSFEYKKGNAENAPHEAGFLKLDNSKIKREFGYEPRIKIKDAVRLTAEWTRVYLNGGNAGEEAERQIQGFFEGAVFNHTKHTHV